MVRPAGGLTYGRRGRRTIGGVSAWDAPEASSAAARRGRASSESSGGSDGATSDSDSDAAGAVQVIVYSSPHKTHGPLKAKAPPAKPAAASAPATRTSPRKPLGERRQDAVPSSSSAAAASSRLQSAAVASSSAQRSSASSSRLQTSVRATPSSSVYFSASSLPSSSPARSAAGRQTEKRAKRSAAGEAQRRIVQLRRAEEEAAIKSPRRASPLKSGVASPRCDDDDEELVRRMGGASLSSELSSLPPSSCPLTLSSPMSRAPAKLKAPSQTLGDLLRLCGQTRAADFSTLLSTLGRPPRGRGRSKASSDPGWRKVGEASYSEVFARGDKVVKIVPLRLGPAEGAEVEGVEHDEWPEESSVEDVGREIEIMRALHGVEGFVELESAHIATGPYAPMLLEAWDEYASSKPEGSENVRPSVLPPSAHYALLLLSHAGQDLEGVRLPNWRAAAAVFWQVVGALGRAERTREFEHRDLHWGNVLVSFSELTVAAEAPGEEERSAATFVASLRRADESGVRATIIDVSLSRLLEPAAAAAAEAPLVLAYDFADESIFTGKGDAQFDVYRAMRTLTRDRWEEWCPRTNVLWLHYLLDKLLHAKGLRRPPGTRSAPATMSALARFRQAAQTDDDERAAYESLAAAAAQLARSLDGGGCGSARELLEWAC